jgi:hypothetical protein
MLRKVSHGWVNFEPQVHSHRNGRGFEDVTQDPEITLGTVGARIDELVALREALATIDDAMLEAAYQEFLESQSQVIELLAPLLDRLAEIGCFNCHYRSDSDRYLWFKTNRGLSVVAGYALYSSLLDEITDPPPEMNAIEVFKTRAPRRSSRATRKQK